MTGPRRSPRLSVVIASWNGWLHLEACLASLEHQVTEGQPEIIVATNWEGEDDHWRRGRFPHVHWLRFPTSCTVPELRGHGMQQAQGDIVALTEDQCVLDKQWCAELLQVHQLPYEVIGGCVDCVHGSSMVDWAVYFYEYSQYMPPQAARVVAALPGNNVSYKRTVLAICKELGEQGWAETFRHWELQREGVVLFLHPPIRVYHNKRSTPAGAAFRQAYHSGRSFGGKRVAGAPALKRRVGIAAAVVLPGLLLWRIALRVLRRRRYVREFILALPMLVVLLLSWSIGEGLGYQLGEGGSAAKWR